MSHRSVLVIVVVALYLGSIPGAALGAPPRYAAGAPGIGDPYFPLDGNGGYDVQRYGLKVT